MLEIIYSDAAFLAVNKPTHLLSVPGRGPDKQDCLYHRMLEQFPDALMVHRLDMDTSGLITHIGGLNAVPEATLDLPNIPGGKKLIYTNMEMPLTAISDFRNLAGKSPLFSDLADICDRHDGLWSVEAEDLLLKYCG